MWNEENRIGYFGFDSINDLEKSLIDDLLKNPINWYQYSDFNNQGMPVDGHAI